MKIEVSSVHIISFLPQRILRYQDLRRWVKGIIYKDRELIKNPIKNMLRLYFKIILKKQHVVMHHFVQHSQDEWPLLSSP